MHQTKIFCPAKVTINKTKRSSTELQKVIVNDISDTIQNIQRTHTTPHQKHK